MNFGAALSKPFSNITNFVIALVLYIIPILNIITIPGYFIRIANRTMNKDDSMPGFENFGELIIDSIKYIVISIVYMIPAIVVFVIALGSILLTILSAITMAGTAEAAQTEIINAVITGLTTVAGLVKLAIILGILGMILIVSGIMNYAKTKQFGKAFAIVENFKNFFTGGFIVAIIVSIVLWIITIAILGAIVGALAVVGLSIVGLIITMIIMFAVNIAIFSLLAEGYPQSVSQSV